MTSSGDESGDKLSSRGSSSCGVGMGGFFGSVTFSDSGSVCARGLLGSEIVRVMLGRPVFAVMILSKRPFGEVRLAVTEVDGVFSLRSSPSGCLGRATVDESERLNERANENGFSATCNDRE